MNVQLRCMIYIYIGYQIKASNLSLDRDILGCFTLPYYQAFFLPPLESALEWSLCLSVSGSGIPAS